MIKLCIKQSEKKTFQKLFKFFLQNECELTIFPEGLKWRNHCASGVVYSGAFIDYSFNQRRKLGVFKGTNEKLNDWFNKWIDKGLFIEIPIK